MTTEAPPEARPGDCVFTIEHRVPARCRQQFLAMEDQLQKAVTSSPGYRSTKMEELAPDVHGTLHFRTTTLFETQDHMLAWVDSETRISLLRQARSEFQFGYELKADVHSFDGWFPAPEDASPGAPPGWKMNLLVLLTLYPTVLILGVVLAPLNGRLNGSAAMLVGNILSVVITGSVLLPVINRWYGPWLRPPVSARARLLGPLSVAAILLAVLLVASALQR